MEVIGIDFKYLNNELWCRDASLDGQVERIEKIMVQNLFQEADLEPDQRQARETRPRLE